MSHHSTSLERLRESHREIRQPTTEFDDAVKSHLLKLMADKVPMTSHFTADVSYVKPQFFTAPYSIFSEGLHLGESREIGSIYVENFTSIAVLQVVFGPNTNQGPPMYLTVNPKTWRRWPLPKGVTSINVVSNADDSGPVTIILTTEIWHPNMGELV